MWMPMIAPLSALVIPEKRCEMMTILWKTTRQYLCVLAAILAITEYPLRAQEPIAEPDQSEVRIHPFDGLIKIFPVEVQADLQ